MRKGRLLDGNDGDESWPRSLKINPPVYAWAYWSNIIIITHLNHGHLETLFFSSLSLYQKSWFLTFQYFFRVKDHRFLIGQITEKNFFFRKFFFDLLTIAISSDLDISHSALCWCPTSPYQRTEKDLTDRRRLFFFCWWEFFPYRFFLTTMDVLAYQWECYHWIGCWIPVNGSGVSERRTRLQEEIRGRERGCLSGSGVTYPASPSPSPLTRRLTMGVVPSDRRLNASKWKWCRWEENSSTRGEKSRRKSRGK